MSGLPPVAPWPALNAQAPACFDLRQVDVHLGPAGRLVALSAVTLRISSGERVALVGANGSGKSTLLRTLHGLQRPQAGALNKPAGQREAMLFQRPHMLRLSALHNIALGLWLQGVPWAQARERAPLALARVGMQDLATRNARALSGGQQQRLALARAWALQPDVWLLDEPTASLDPHAKREVEALIADFT
ncbi:MAG: ATP-binding cassette domain-containing protein, partial [Hydrogenophaga sp.]|nr:ATP-binding cassette domain-containing protein [Hydrogenophaga sp.]